VWIHIVVKHPALDRTVPLFFKVRYDAPVRAHRSGGARGFVTGIEAAQGPALSDSTGFVLYKQMKDPSVERAVDVKTGISTRFSLSNPLR